MEIVTNSSIKEKPLQSLILEQESIAVTLHPMYVLTGQSARGRRIVAIEIGTNCDINHRLKGAGRGHSPRKWVTAALRLVISLR
jgi:hypothetical protein